MDAVVEPLKADLDPTLGDFRTTVDIRTCPGVQEVLK